MAVTLSKSHDEIQQMPLVEIAFDILKAKKEPLYFRDLMREIQELRGFSDDAVNDVIARLYTEINIDGRFICVGQNVWGLHRWYPVDKAPERNLAGKKFVRRNTGDAFGDDDDFEDLDEETDVLEEDSDSLLPADEPVEDNYDDEDDAEVEDETEEVESEEFETEPLEEDDDEDEDED